VEEILDRQMVNRKLHYLVKWEGFGVEHNSWEPWDNVHAPELVADFYRRHPGAAHHIRMVNFRSIPFCSVSGRHCLEGGWMLGDAPHRPTSPPIFLCHLCIFLLIVASPRRSALAAPIPESDDHVHIAFLSLFHHSPSFSSFYYFDSNFWYIDMHPTLAGFYPFLLGSPARCAFLSYLCLYICLGSTARSRLSCPQLP